MLPSKPNNTPPVRRESIIHTLATQAVAAPLPASLPQPLVITPPRVFLVLSKPRIRARVRAPVALRRTVAYRLGNCITVVRLAGYSVPRTKDGFARTVPITSTKLPPEGKKVVIKTAESKMGHVLVAVNKGGKLISVVDSVGKGRVIPLSVYRGFISPS